MIDESISSALHKVRFSAENVVRGAMGEEDTKVLTATALLEIHTTLLLLAQQIAQLQEKK